MASETLTIDWGADGFLWGNDTPIWGPTVAPVEPEVIPTEEQPTIYFHQLLTVETEPVLRMTTFWEREVVIRGETYIGGLGGVNFRNSVIGIGPDGRQLNSTIRFQVGDASNDPAQIGQQGYDTVRRFLTQRLGGIFAQVEIIFSHDGLQWEILPNTIRGRLSNSQLQGDTFTVEIVSESLEAYNKEELVWSHEVQQRLTDGQDLGFEQAKRIAGRTCEDQISELARLIEGDMRVNDEITKVMQRGWEWQTNDCITLAEKVTGELRPAWMETDTEEESHKIATADGTRQYDKVVEELDAVLDRVEPHEPRKAGDVVMSPKDKEWTLSYGRRIVKPHFDVWAIGVLDDSLNVVTFSKGRLLNFSPIGLRWRKRESKR